MIFLKNFIVQSIFNFQIGNFRQLYSTNSQILSSIAGGVPNATWHAFSVFTHRSIKENEDLGIRLENLMRKISRKNPNPICDFFTSSQAISIYVAYKNLQETKIGSNIRGDLSITKGLKLMA